MALMLHFCHYFCLEPFENFNERTMWHIIACQKVSRSTPPPLPQEEERLQQQHNIQELKIAYSTHFHDQKQASAAKHPTFL